MYQFTYPVKLTPDEADGGFTVTCRDLPEAITQGETRAEALAEAADCLEEAIAGRIDDGAPIPPPSAVRPEEEPVPVPAQTAFKAALYLALRESGLTKVELAQRIGANEKEARRILDPHHGTKLPAMERALAALGKRVELRVG